MNRRNAGLFALAFALAFTPVARAHTDEYLDSLKAPHGGQLRMSGPYHFELVIKPGGQDAGDTSVLVYLTDHAGNGIASAGASGTAQISAGKSTATAKLTPDGENRLKGSVAFALARNMRTTLSVRFADGKTYQAEFAPVAKSPAKHAP